MSSTFKHQSVLLEGLAQALASPGDVLLFSSKSTPGLYPHTAVGKAAARQALDQGWLSTVRRERRGKSVVEVVALTSTGSAYVLDQVQPRPLLEAIQAALSDRTRQLAALHATVRTCQHDVEVLQARVQGIAARMEANTVIAGSVCVTEARWEERLPCYLQARQQARPAEDCPLPELFQQAREVTPALSVGAFHEGLRRLQAEQRIALQPWTGPLHELPEPNLALMHGHSLAYYASPVAR